MTLRYPSLSEKVRQTLSNLGVDSEASLAQHSPVTLFLWLKANGLTLTFHVFWQIIALVSNRDIAAIDQHEKAYWLEQLKRHAPVRVMPNQATMEHFMRRALQLAQQAANAGEVPVGAVVVFNQQIIGEGANACIKHQAIDQHAELIALRQAFDFQNNWRLENCDVYVTLEPCAMCAGALLQSRVARIIYGAKEAKSGALGSVVDLSQHRTLNAQTAVLGGVLADESQQLLQHFFRAKR